MSLPSLAFFVKFIKLFAHSAIFVYENLPICACVYKRCHDSVRYIAYLTLKVRYRGYYTAVRRYEFYLRVVKTIFYERAQRVEYCFHHEKIKFISSNRRVMFCLLYSCKQSKTQVSNIDFRL